jgi:hypothetical protein
MKKLLPILLTTALLFGLGGAVQAASWEMLTDYNPNFDEETEGSTVFQGKVNGNLLEDVYIPSTISTPTISTWDVYTELPGGWESKDTAGIEIQGDGLVVPAHSGQHYVELDSHTYKEDENTVFTKGDTNSIALNKIPPLGESLFLPYGWGVGYSMEFSFWYQPRVGTGSTDKVQAKVWVNNELAGQTLATRQNYNAGDNYENGWLQYIIPLDLSELGNDVPISIKIRFNAKGLDDTYGGLIDTLSLTGNTPEPGTMILFGSAAGLVGFIRRRRKK